MSEGGSYHCIYVHMYIDPPRLQGQKGTIAVIELYTAGATTGASGSFKISSLS